VAAVGGEHRARGDSRRLELPPETREGHPKAVAAGIGILTRPEDLRQLVASVWTAWVQRQIGEESGDLLPGKAGDDPVPLRAQAAKEFDSPKSLHGSPALSSKRENRRPAGTDPRRQIAAGRAATAT